MKIYVLSKQGYDGNETICVSEDINKIRSSIWNLEKWRNDLSDKW